MKRIVYLAVCVLPLLVLTLTDVCAQSRYHADKGERFLRARWYDTAFNEFKQGEAAGEEESAIQLLKCYIKEIGTPRNLAKARALLEKWYKKSPEMCRLAMWYYATEECADFANNISWALAHESIEPNMTTCRKYVEYANENYKDKIGDYWNHVYMMYAYIYARGEGGATRSWEKAVRYNPENGTYSHSVVEEILEFIPKLNLDADEINKFMSEFRRMGIKIDYSTSLLGDMANTALKNLDESLYIRYTDEMMSKITESLKSYGSKGESVRLLLLNYMIRHAIDINDANTSEGSRWAEELDLIRNISGGASCDDMWIENITWKMQPKNSYGYYSDNLIQLKVKMKDLIAQSMIKDVDAFKGSTAYQQVMSMVLRREVLESYTDANDLYEEIANKNASLEKWYKALGIPKYISDETSEKLSVKSVEELEELLAKSKNVIKKLKEGKNYNSNVRKIKADNQKFIDNMGSLNGVTDAVTLENVKGAYKKAFESLNFTWSPNIDTGSLEKRVKSLQDGVRDYFVVIQNIAADDAKFATENKKYKKDFANYQIVRNGISTEYNPFKSIKETEEMIKALRENFRIFHELLAKQDKVNADILTKGENCKNIIAAYKAFFKDQDRIWEDDSSTNKVRAISYAQNQLLKILERPNLDAIDKDIKKQKIKTLDGVFSYIESLN